MAAFNLEPRPGLDTKRRLGVALGGGTARAYAHVGALQVLEVHTPGVLAGTSYGALIAALYALEPDAKRIARWASGQDMLTWWSRNLDAGFSRASLVAGEKIERWLDELFGGATFADTRLPLLIACTDVDTGELVLLREGSLARAVRASCALPGLYAVPEVAGRRLVDGGFVMPVPAAPLLDLSEVVVGLHAGVEVERAASIRLLKRWQGSNLGQAFYARVTHSKRRNAWSALGKGLAHAAASYSRAAPVPSDCLLVKTAPPVAWWDFHKSDMAVAAGERAMRAALPELERRLGGKLA